VPQAWRWVQTIFEELDSQESIADFPAMISRERKEARCRADMIATADRAIPTL
jgi:hypothetical protein